MTGPITTDDLYGSSDTNKPKEPSLSIPIEETPEIVAPPAAEASGGKEVKSPPPVKKKPGCFGFFVKIIIIIALVAIGIWVSSYVRQFFSKNPQITKKTETPITPTPIYVSEATTAASWKTYDAMNGVAFQLPLDVLSPICDGSNCASKGTYLPGGTRFTVAPRGAGHVLADFRGTAIADVAGVTFTTKSVTVAGLPAMEFTGTFTGGTVSGYRFSAMRGVMIEITPTTSLEMNHFTPTGIIADYASDDALFDEILKTLTVRATQ